MILGKLCTILTRRNVEIIFTEYNGINCSLAAEEDFNVDENRNVTALSCLCNVNQNKNK